MAVTKEARRASAAFQFLRWASEPSVVAALGPASESTTLFARSQLPVPQSWINPGLSDEAAGQYAKTVETSFARPLFMPTVRLPGCDQYLSSLDGAVAKLITEEAMPEDALKEAAKAWDAITAKLEVSKQRRAYQRSLGNDF